MTTRQVLADGIYLRGGFIKGKGLEMEYGWW